MIKFETGKTYRMRSICDYNCIWDLKIISRTAKTVTLKIENEVKRFRVKEHDGAEFVMPLGSFSMSPALSASKELKPKTRDIYISDGGIEEPFDGQDVRVQKSISFLTENKDTGVKYYAVKGCSLKICSALRAGVTFWYMVCQEINRAKPKYDLPLASGLVLCISE